MNVNKTVSRLISRLTSPRDAKCYVTGILIQFTPDEAERPTSTTTPTPVTVEVLRADNETGEALLVEMVSALEWKYDGIIDIADKTTFIVGWHDARQQKRIALVARDIVKECRKIPIGPPEELELNFATNEDRPLFSLKFSICTMPLNEDILDRDLPIYNNFLGALSKHPQKIFSAVLELKDTTPIKSGLLLCCANHSRELFHKTMDKSDIDTSILSFELAIKLIKFSPTTETRYLRTLHLAGLAQLDRYNLLEEKSDIDLAIQMLQFVANFRAHGRPGKYGAPPKLLPLKHRPDTLAALANCLSRRFQKTRDVDDISEAIDCLEKVTSRASNDLEVISEGLKDLGCFYRYRYQEEMNFDDLQEAISNGRLSIKLTPKGDENMPARLISFAVSLEESFQSIGFLEGISEAITTYQKVIDITPEGHKDLAARRNQLGLAFQSRFKSSQDLPDLVEAISNLQEAVTLTPQEHKELPARLIQLSLAFQLRFQHKGEGDLAFISEAICYQEKAVELTPEGDKDLPHRLNSLGTCLSRRFALTKDFSDISKAISYQQKAVQLGFGNNGPGEIPSSQVLGNLGFAFQHRFLRTGNLADISEAISYQQKAVELVPPGDVKIPTLLSNLGASFQSRFEHTGDPTDISDFQPGSEHRGDLADISEAILYQRKAIDLAPPGHEAMPTWLSNLGVSYVSRFERTGHLKDISEAISYQRTAVSATPEGHSDLPIRLNNLGISLQSRFAKVGDPNDISEAISCQQTAFQLVPEGHGDTPTWLNNLGSSLQSRFKHTGNLADIDEAISYGRRAVDLMPDSHAKKPLWLANLGNSLLCRFGRTADAADMQAALSAYRQAATYHLGSPLTRFGAAKEWAKLCKRSDRSQLLDAYTHAIHMVSQVAGLGKTIEKRHTSLLEISNLSASAAAAAFESERHRTALELLEEGRCLVWNQLNNLRTPLDALHAQNPEIAKDIIRVSRSLESAGSRKDTDIPTPDASMAERKYIQERVATHHELSEEWVDLLSKARKIPEFEDFLLPLSYSALIKHLPKHGVVIIINIHSDRCDALALRTETEKPLHIPLVQFSYAKADYLLYRLNAHLRTSGLRMPGYEGDTRGMRYEGEATVIKDILGELWGFVVKPIIDGLGYTEPPSTLLRIWWCANGPLSFLPIHAAGIYGGSIDPKISSTLPDFAISSYTPTVRALVDRVKRPQTINEKRVGLFMISQPDTPNLPRIPGTADEVRAIKRRLEGHDIRVLCLERDAATVDKAITNMEMHSCIHFACHASQNISEPLKSGFALHDGRLELSSLIQKNLLEADLAFLSACQTSTGDEKLSDEVVHLVAGMLAAGYRGVVGTMWSIEDRYGRKVAEDFYADLMSYGGGLNSRHASSALHYATQNLRKTLGDSEASLLVWVPYVHFGL